MRSKKIPQRLELAGEMGMKAKKTGIFLLLCKVLYPRSAQTSQGCQHHETW